ncbi:EamA family transporter [Neomoorella humiferrea]|uniref:Putative 4-amino-4-deoxy-L-arabinose-phosphoundecaprenol flippase subunit ArnE n=1 Tax=Neomoorella humiferrea TaxID=676965 RepID=A0A2T0ANT5_9FIRM|nr:EamA family transporter [Moorella humiferrea]PRR70677.1 putative 4-amino-4-deoxy-L-arabinose-phosphoundecaprenol flippase subunit ArnE [Moorella humiferrea]
MAVYGLILLNVVLLVSGQVFWKLGLDRLGGLSVQNWTGVFISPFIWSGIVLYVLATVVWFIVLSRANLSVAYPMQSIAYVFGMLAGLFIFQESITPLAWLGMVLVMTGVTLIGLR